jgi:hypothetical protein
MNTQIFEVSFSKFDAETGITLTFVDTYEVVSVKAAIWLAEQDHPEAVITAVRAC